MGGEDKGEGGLGVDVVEIGRIREIASRAPRFLVRVFGAEEIKYCRRFRDPWPHYAVRFAAKEAVWKALGLSRVQLKDITVGRDASGRPFVVLSGKRAPRVMLSLSHGRDYAVAVALRRR